MPSRRPGGSGHEDLAGGPAAAGGPGRPAGAPRITVGAALAVAAADDAFGADLYRELGSGGRNLVFSPVSIAAALQMALLGARGDTAAQLAAALHLASPRAAGDGLRLLAAGLAGTDALTGQDGVAGGGVILRAPNTMWVQEGLPLRPEFASELAGLAAATVRGADFAGAAEQARLEINATIARQTEGKIADLLARGVVTAATRLVLASAVYLKAAWVQPFRASATGDHPFQLGGGAETVVAMMRLRARLGYRRGDGFQTVLLRYRGERLALAVILPDGPIGPLEETLAAGQVRGFLAGSTPRQVRLALPRFRVTAAFALRPVLAALGMAAAFSGQADFSGISPAARLAISEVVHKTYIDVNEQGTEAAAAAAGSVAMARLATPSARHLDVTVDRPFLFAIIDTGTGLPLFLGRITDPQAG